MRLTSFLSLAALFLAQQGIAQNLLQNGKLNQDAQGWEIAKSGASQIEFSNSYLDYGLTDNFVGLGFVELDEQSAIQQTVATTKGAAYVLAFNFSHRPDAGDKQLIVLLNGKPIYTEKISNNSNKGGFANKHLSFVADQEQSTISFLVASLSGDASKGVLLRDVLLGKENELDLKLYYSY